jgi:hypothetical protein
MSNRATNYVLEKKTQTLGASVTTQAVSEQFKINDSGRLNLLVDIICTDVTAGGGITAYLQDKAADGYTSTWNSVKSVAITANGTFTIRVNVQNSTDQGYTPLRSLGRIVVTTGAGSAIDIDQVLVYQAD